MDDHNKEKWHLSKTVNISHIATTVLLVVGMVTYIGDIEKSVAVQEVEIQNIKVKMEDRARRESEMFARIEDKLDKLFDLIHEDNGK